MLLEDLKDKKIFMLGVTSTGIAIQNYLKDTCSIFMWDANEKIKNKFKDSYKIIDSLESVNFDDYDFFILTKDLLMFKEDFDTLLKRLETVKDKVFLDIEFLYNLFPLSRYIGIVGSGYNHTVNHLVSNISKESNFENFIYSPFKERNFPESSSINYDLAKATVSISLRQTKIKYIKQLGIDILAMLDIDENDDLEDLKKKITFKNENSVIILNVDNATINDKIYVDNLKNNTFSSKVIPLSITKILKNGISYIGNTIYNYYNNKNNSYDIGTEYTNDIIKMSVLCAFTMALELGIDVNIVKECLGHFSGIENYLENIGQVENIRFLNNVEANNNKSLLSPYDSYSNIYSIVLVNGKQSENILPKKFLSGNNKVFIVDLHNLFNLDENKVTRFTNLANAFEAAVDEAKKEEKENEITILLTPLVGEDMNSIYYPPYGEEFRNLFNNFKKKE